MIFISGVIIYSLVTVATRSVNSVFERTVCNFATAFLLFNRTKNMKKLTYYILSAVFAVCNLSSCLDEDPIYSQNSAVMFSSQSNAELALLGCYGYLTNSATYGQMMQEALIISSGFGWGQRNSNDDGRMLSLETPTSASPVKTVWNGLYKVVTEANAFLGSCEDKRIPGINIDQSRVLVIRGNVSFGSIEIKG